MPSIDIKLETPIKRTARVMQIEGMFDVPEAANSVVELPKMDVDLDAKPWSIGLITGPSGCGKSTIAKHLFGDLLIEGYEWDPERAVADCFGDEGVNETVAALSSVGFSSPPAWLRPFHVLSNGEKFRVNLARALLDPRPRIAIDEFTSVVDRKVAQIGSYAVAKQVRKRPGQQLVAVTCHNDLVEWLQPDWVLEPHVGLMTWRSVQPRPAVEVEIVRCSHAAWPWFAPHHYLSASVHRAARLFVGTVKGEPVYCAAVLQYPHPHIKKAMRISRAVVMPDFQGCGIGTALGDKIAAICRTNGYGARTCTAHPGLIRARRRSPLWRMDKLGRRRHSLARPTMSGLKMSGSMHSLSNRRMTASFRYIGGPVPPHEVAAARMMWNGR